MYLAKMHVHLPPYDTDLCRLPRRQGDLLPAVRHYAVRLAELMGRLEKHLDDLSGKFPAATGLAAHAARKDERSQRDYLNDRLDLAGAWLERMLVLKHECARCPEVIRYLPRGDYEIFARPDSTLNGFLSGSDEHRDLTLAKRPYAFHTWKHVYKGQELSDCVFAKQEGLFNLCHYDVGGADLSPQVRSAREKHANFQFLRDVFLAGLTEPFPLLDTTVAYLGLVEEIPV